jgi:hypothetical protein
MPGVFTVVAIIGVIVSTIASVTSAVIVIPTPITVVTAPVTLAVAAVRSVALIPVLAAITASAATSGATTTRHHSPAPHAAHRVWLGRGFLHVNLFVFNSLFGRLQQLVDDLFRFERDETETFSLIFCFIKRHLHLDNIAVLTKIVFDVVIGELVGQASHENLPVPRLRFLWIDFLVVDDVFTSGDHFVDGFRVVEDDKSESSRSASVRVGFDVDTFDFAVLSEMVSQLLVSCFPTQSTNKQFPVNNKKRGLVWVQTKRHPKHY